MPVLRDVGRSRSNLARWHSENTIAFRANATVLAFEASGDSACGNHAGDSRGLTVRCEHAKPGKADRWALESFSWSRWSATALDADAADDAAGRHWYDASFAGKWARATQGGMMRGEEGMCPGGHKALSVGAKWRYRFRA